MSGVSKSTRFCEQGLKEPLGQGAFVAQQFAEQSACQVWERLAIIYVSRRDLAGEQVSTILDDQMQLEPVKPLHRILPSLGQSPKDPMLLNAAVVADGQGGRVHEADACALSLARVEIGT